MNDHTLYVAVVIGGCLALAAATAGVALWQLVKLRRLRAERARLAADLEVVIADAMRLIEADRDFRAWAEELEDMR